MNQTLKKMDRILIDGEGGGRCKQEGQTQQEESTKHVWDAVSRRVWLGSNCIRRNWTKEERIISRVTGLAACR